MWVQIINTLFPWLVVTEARHKTHLLETVKIRGRACPISCFCGMGAEVSQESSETAGKQPRNPNQYTLSLSHVTKLAFPTASGTT